MTNKGNTIYKFNGVGEEADSRGPAHHVVDRGVFINYRSEDTHSYAALLYTELSRQFGAERVFLDAESIPAGADFVQELLRRVRSASVLLAVIGPRWLTTTDPTGRRRIDDRADWIRRELAEAFAAGVRVIPVLTDQARMPAQAELPADIAALSRCQYRHLRHREPTTDLARLVTDLTSLEPGLAAACSQDGTPRQLPAAPRYFVGRANELAALTSALDESAGAGGTVLIAALAGAGGIGKTALALRWAQANLHRFPDGQIFVDLQGFTPAGLPMEPVVAVRRFLDAFGVDPGRIPADLDAQAALYRSLVAGKQMLIVLDNAANASQVVPLLPGSTTCTVIVTSRRHLTSLITRHSAHHLTLDALTDDDARHLLSTRIGADRVTAEPAAAEALLASCGGFALALDIVAAHATMHPHTPLAELAADLHHDTTQLAILDDDDPAASLPATLSWSYHALTTEQRTVFGLVGIAPGPEIGLPAATSLTGLSQPQARAVLRALEDASLLDRRPASRYTMHDLIRAYAAYAAHRDLPEDTRQAALGRVLDFYTHTAHTADRLLNPHRAPLHLDSPELGAHPLPDVAAALDWFETEHPQLLAAQHTATSHTWHPTVWLLAWALTTYHHRRGHRYDQLAMWRSGLDAATHLSDPATSIHAHGLLGVAYSALGRHGEAIGHLQQALALAEHHDDPTQQADTHHLLAQAWELKGDDRRALKHAIHSLALRRVLQQPAQEADALNAVGWCAARCGDYETARAHCCAALALYQRRDDRGGEAAAMDSLGYIDHHAGHHNHAIDQYRQAVALRRDLGDTYFSANSLDALGHPHTALGQHEQARAVWREALELYRQQGRDEDATRVQRQLYDLDKHNGVVGSRGHATDTQDH